MTDFTANCGLRKPNRSDWNWHHGWGDNQDIVDVVFRALQTKNRVLAGCGVTLSTGLGYEVAAGSVYLGGQYVSVSPATPMVAVPDGTGDNPILINWIYVNASGVVEDSTAYPGGEHVLLAKIDTMEVAGVIQLHDLRPMGYGEPEKPRPGTEFVDADLVSGILVYDHNLDVDYLAAVTIWDNNKAIIQPDEVTTIDNNSISVDLTSYLPLTGTWHLSIRN